jgi:hypothetical protein
MLKSKANRRTRECRYGKQQELLKQIAGYSLSQRRYKNIDNCKLQHSESASPDAIV